METKVMQQIHKHID